MVMDPQPMLQRATQGDRAALDRLIETVYQELRRMAAASLRRERHCATLQPTALVNQALLRILGDTRLADLDRTHFLAIAARVIRQVLVEHARTRLRLKRGGRSRRVTLSDEIQAVPGASLDVLALDEALTQLSAMDERQAQVVELRFFGGLTVEEVAGRLGLSKRTVESEWTIARAWLRRALREAPEAGQGSHS